MGLFSAHSSEAVVSLPMQLRTKPRCWPSVGRVEWPGAVLLKLTCSLCCETLVLLVLLLGCRQDPAPEFSSFPGEQLEGVLANPPLPSVADHSLQKCLQSDLRVWWKGVWSTLGTEVPSSVMRDLPGIFLLDERALFFPSEQAGSVLALTIHSEVMQGFSPLVASLWPLLLWVWSLCLPQRPMTGLI